MKRLDIDPAEVALVPHEPAEILARCFGGSRKTLPRKQIFAFAAVSNQPCAMAFMHAMRNIKPADLKLLSLEAMCVRAKVSPVELLGSILMSAKSMKATESAMKAILAHPDVVDATIDAATQGTPIFDEGGNPFLDKRGRPILAGHGDDKAQKMLHEAVGFLPTKKGGGVEINFGFGRPAEDRDEDSDADADWDEAFPQLGDNIQNWSEDKHKLLEGKKD